MAETINLYIDLQEGELADLEVVARASLSFANAVREVAYVVDPSLAIKIEIESGTEGSLSINSILKTIKDTVIDKVTAKVIVGVIIGWFAKETAATLWSLAIEDMITNETQISEQDAQKIAEKVKELLEKNVGEKQANDVFRQLEKDRSVKGVGVGVVKGSRPRYVVPRERFREIYDEKIEEESVKNRNRTERMMLTIISPVLQENHNKWRFLSKDGMISADILDEAFVQDLVRGKVRVPMKGGVVIIANVENKEKFINGVWVIQKRSVSKVISIDYGDGQHELFSEE